MAHEQAFNLVDAAWIPLAGSGPVSLREVFTRGDIGELGGNPMQKIALLKLFLAIAQAAHTPEDDVAWAALNPEGMGKVCLDYLEKWHDAFWLYGEKPFLQMPAIARAKITPFAIALPYISKNATLLFDSQRGGAMNNAEKALLIVVHMGFGFGGKKADNTIVLTPGYTGKKSSKGKEKGTGKPGPFLGRKGYQHHFFIGSSLRESIWLNLLTAEDLRKLAVFPQGLGTPPWERMPEGEDCPIAKALKNSLMGRLIPLSKFILLTENGIHYSDGILHPNHKEDGLDPSIATDHSGKEAKAQWADPEEQFWRSLPAFLAFLDNKQGLSCFGIRQGLGRVSRQVPRFAIWAGGVQVSDNSGEYYVSGSSDFVESIFWFCSKDVMEPSWFSLLEAEIIDINTLSNSLCAAARGYRKYQEAKNEKDRKKDKKRKAKDNDENKKQKDGDQSHKDKSHVEKAKYIFWQMCNGKAQELIDACGVGTQKELRPVFANFAHTAYNSACPHDTARQLEAWAAHSPNTAKYLQTS